MNQPAVQFVSSLNWLTNWCQEPNGNHLGAKKVYKALINAKFGNKLLFFEETRKVASHSVVHNKLKAPVYFFKFRFYSL